MSPLAVSNWDVMLVLLVAALVLTPQGYLVFRLDRYVRRKGYQSPFRALFFTSAFMAVAVLGFVADARHPDSCWSCSPAANPEFFRQELMWGHVRRFAYNLGTTTTIGLAVVAIVAWLVPRRARRSGRRQVRFPFRAAGLVCLMGVPLSILFGIMGILGWSSVFRVGVLSSGAYASCAYLARRSQSKPLDQVIQEDPRPPVLYLRPFDREDDYFTAPLNEQCQALGIPIQNPSAFRQTATFEEYFVREITARLGPFVALGDPNDYLPPGGAARAYLEDDGWQDVFLGMVRDSACILAALGESEHLEWELRAIRSKGFHTKLFALTSPPTKGRWYSVQWGRSVKRQWMPFARELTKSGFMPGDYPGDGAAIGFDASGRALVLATNCRMPEDYMSAIESHLRSS